MEQVKAISEGITDPKKLLELIAILNRDYKRLTTTTASTNKPKRNRIISFTMSDEPTEKMDIDVSKSDNISRSDSSDSSTLKTSPLDNVDSELDNHSDFELPNKRKRKYRPVPVTFHAGLQTNNKFDILNNISDKPNETEGTNIDESEPAAPSVQIDPVNPSTSPQDKQPRIPPLVLREPAKWNAVSSLFNRKSINYNKAKNHREGIHIFPSTETDYRRAAKALDEVNIQYHIYRLQSDKYIKTVIRGIPPSLTETQVAEDLVKQGYPDVKVSRMVDREGRSLPMVRVDVPRLYKNIYNISTICKLSITVEAAHKKASTGQCHRCQLFGHSQAGCRAEYRCLKCAENHSTHECLKPLSLPAKCANCAGPHPANYGRCPENPRSKVPQRNNTHSRVGKPNNQLADCSNTAIRTGNAERTKPKLVDPSGTGPSSSREATLPQNIKQAPAWPSLPAPRPTNGSTNPFVETHRQGPSNNNASPRVQTNSKDLPNVNKNKRDLAATAIGELVLFFHSLNHSETEMLTFVTKLNTLTQLFGL